jgi:putative ABC transport system substrate-binding protein
MDGAPDASKGRAQPRCPALRPRRRTFLGGVAASIALSRAALGQPRPRPVIGFLNSASPETYAFNVKAFHDGLKQVGFFDGDNIQIEYRWANSDYARLPELARELVEKGVLAIAATGDVASARAAQSATKTIPVVFTIGGDPVRFGLVSSYNQPGGNITGINLVPAIMSAKRIELLHEIAPQIRRVAILINPSNFNAAAEQRDAEEGGRSLGLEVIALQARNQQEIDAAFGELLDRGAEAIITGTDPIVLARREQIVGFAAQHALPVVGFVREFADVGGLLSYGPSITWMYWQAGVYIGQILKGSNPANLPVLQPTRYEFVVNLKAAARLGIDLPLAFITRADEVIE